MGEWLINSLQTCPGRITLCVTVAVILGMGFVKKRHFQKSHECSP